MITEHRKTTKKLVSAMEIAGFFPDDPRIEFVGRRSSKKVYWSQYGKTKHFNELPESEYNLLVHKYLSTPRAVTFLSSLTGSFKRQIELFTYYIYGGCDNIPDIDNGKLSDSENFRDTENCPSLLWNCKNITIDKYDLTMREVFIADSICKGTKDLATAMDLGLSQSHLDTLKRELYKKTGCTGKPDFIRKYVEQQANLRYEK